MDNIISALYNLNPFQTGENGSKEYGWSNNIRERIVQINFQLTRSKQKNSHNA